MSALNFPPFFQAFKLTHCFSRRASCTNIRRMHSPVRTFFNDVKCQQSFGVYLYFVQSTQQIFVLISGSHVRSTTTSVDELPNDDIFFYIFSEHLMNFLIFPFCCKHFQNDVPIQKYVVQPTFSSPQQLRHQVVKSSKRIFNRVLILQT